MQNMSIHGVLTSIAAALAVGLSAAPAQAASYSQLFVFGDSLSDAAGGSNVNPFAPNQGGLVPPFPYSNGRFSNGPVAVEYLASSLGLDAAHTYQFAIGGARTDTGGTIPGTGLSNQLQAFSLLAPSLGSLSGSLFTVWAGANDFRDSLSLANPTTQFGTILGNLGSAITTLYGLGARDFLLPNLPDVGVTPEGIASQQGPTISFLAGVFNASMASYYNGLEGQLSGARFHYVNAFAAQHQLIAAAPGNGLTNLTEPCLVTLDKQLANLDCSSAFFVDNIHPTTQVHQALGQAMLAAAVPEPQTLLLLAVGVVGLIGLGRHRARSAAAAAEVAA